MTETEISRLLELQRSAYELLLWIDGRARTDSEMLSDTNLEKWRYATSCEAWMRDIYGMIPRALRPLEAEIPAFARLFSAFFVTSFHLDESAPTPAYDKWGEKTGYVGSGRRRLVAGSPEGKKTPKGKAKVDETARELRLIALEELALEGDLLLSRVELDAFERAAPPAALTLWTYVHELNRRAHFASQGAPVRALWLAMDKKERENISAAQVVAARARLLALMRIKLRQAANSTYEST